MPPAKPSHPPLPLYTAEEVRAIDRFGIDIQGIAGIELMERAGSAAFDHLQSFRPQARTLSVVCGGGNNGGDGYILARLAHQQGWDVRAYAVTAPASLKGDAQLACQRYLEAGGSLLDFIPHDFESAEVVADALLGTGLDRPVTGPHAAIICAINRYRTHRADARRVIALDLPSGLNGNTGAVMGVAVKADLTITFVGRKRGLYTGEGLELTGLTLFEDLGIGGGHGLTASACLEEGPPPALPARARSTHKGCCGHLLVLGGDRGLGGAARLAAEAAARVGAGLVSLATHPDHAATLTLTCPELMTHAVERPEQLAALLERATILAIGPGLGRGEWGRQLLSSAMAARRPMIVDADALNTLAKSPQHQAEWVLTPHPGEAGRLLGVTAHEIQSDRFAALEKLKERYGGTVVLKGSGTLVGKEGGITTVCRVGNPGMASGGMGDVLTGVIAGLAAQGLPLHEAARLGVRFHGAAGDQAARQGERGLLASDLIAQLRPLINGVGSDE